MLSASDTFTDDIEAQWLNQTSLEMLMAGYDFALPLNIIGRAALDVQAQLKQQFPKLRVNAAVVLGAGLGEESLADIRRAQNLLARRSCTLVLDPTLANVIIDDTDLLARLSSHTFEWLRMPLFVKGQPLVAIHSPIFSFQEPVGDDLASHTWRWATSPQQAEILLSNSGDSGRYCLSFTVGTATECTLTINLGEVEVVQVLNRGTPTAIIHLECYLPRGDSVLTFKCDGRPFIPDPALDQRRALYYSISSFSLTARSVALLPSPAPAPTFLNVLNDRQIRRRFHDAGFFEVQSLSGPTKALVALSGIRSCYDYQEGFSVRDYRKFDWFAPIGLQMSYGIPALWYSVRKTPTPGSEW